MAENSKNRPKTAPQRAKEPQPKVHGSKKTNTDDDASKMKRKVSIQYTQSHGHPEEIQIEQTEKSTKDRRKEIKLQKEHEQKNEKHLTSEYQHIHLDMKKILGQWRKEMDKVKLNTMMGFLSTITKQIEEKQVSLGELLVKYEVADNEERPTSGEQKQTEAGGDQHSTAEHQENSASCRDDRMELRQELDNYKAMNNSLHDRINDLERSIQEKDEQIAKIPKQDWNRPATAPARGSDMEKRIKRYETEVEILKSTLKEKSTLSEKFEMEKNDALSRLSEIAGRRLRDNNPNVTDLSTQIRPIKIAESYRELYDNQWTDAYFALHEKNEKPEDIIKTLLKILRKAYSFSKRNCTYIDDALTSYNTYLDTTKPETKTLELPEECRSLAKQLRKSMATVLLPELQKEFVNIYDSDSDLNEVKAYRQKCVEITWYMSLQTPPMVFADIPEKGTEVDTALYSHYTVSGRFVDYVVWPACRFDNGGNLLAKGVAQPLKESKENAGQTKAKGSDDAIKNNEQSNHVHMEDQNTKF